MNINSPLNSLVMVDNADPNPCYKYLFHSYIRKSARLRGKWIEVCFFGADSSHIRANKMSIYDLVFLFLTFIFYIYSYNLIKLRYLWICRHPFFYIFDSLATYLVGTLKKRKKWSMKGNVTNRQFIYVNCFFAHKQM